MTSHISACVSGFVPSKLPPGAGFPRGDRFPPGGRPPIVTGGCGGVIETAGEPWLHRALERLLAAVTGDDTPRVRRILAIALLLPGLALVWTHDLATALVRSVCGLMPKLLAAAMGFWLLDALFPLADLMHRYLGVLEHALAVARAGGAP